MPGTPVPKKAKKKYNAEIPLLFTITIKAYGNKRVEVSGHPTNLFIALDVMRTAQVAIENQFQKLAAAGRLDRNLTITESNIVQVKSPIVGPDGGRLG